MTTSPGEAPAPDRIWPPGIRWAKASPAPGHFCMQEDHAASDYDNGIHAVVRHDKEVVKVSGRTCGICWPKPAPQPQQRKRGRSR